MTKRKLAFTLAEVLITLSVIGIVAALTIPGMVKNHNEKAWATAQDVFTKKLEVAMKVMNTDGTLTGYSTTASFVNALKKNIKITKVCTDDVTKCFSKEVIWNEGEEPVEVTNTAVKYDDSQGQDWAETVGVQFTNGITALIAYNKNCSPDPYNNQEAVTGQCIGIIYDVQGHKNPNTNGKDIASNANVATLGGSSGCIFEFSDGKCITQILGPQNGGYSALSNADCTSRQSELGLTYCDSGHDYYAGAAAACGGKSNLPSSSHLVELAAYVYDGATIADGTSTTTGLTLNTDNAQAFHAQSPYSSDFYIWAQQEHNSALGYIRFFTSTSTWYDYRDVLSNSRQYATDVLAVCIGE